MASNQDLSLWQKVINIPRLLRKALILVLFGLLGISITWGIPQLYYPAKATPPPSFAQVQTPLDTLIQQANTSYEAGQFTQAEATWQEVVNSISGGLLNQSLQLVQALSNLSLSQQAQAKWGEAQRNINDALRILSIAPPPAPIQINSRDQDTLRILAQSLDIRGQLSYLTGHPETALFDWQYSQQLYQSIKGYPQGKLNSLLNQAQAYQALGQYQRAEDSLKAVEKISQGANRDFKIKVLQSLAQTERLMGKLQDASNHLQAARTLFGQVTNNADDQILLAKLELELGNVRQASAIRNRDLGKWVLSRELISAALQSYEFAIKDVQDTLSESTNSGKEHINSETKTIQLQGRLNQLSLRTTFAMELAENNYAFNNGHQIRELVEKVKLLLADPELPISRKTVDARTHYAEILMTLAKFKSEQHNNHDSVTQLFKVENLQEDSFENLAISIKQAHEELKNFRAEANAVGRLGELYIDVWESTKTDNQHQYAQYAYKTLEEAIALSTLAHAPDIRYRWHYQIGHLLESQVETQEDTQISALKAYRAAIHDLRKVRKNLLSVNSEVRFSFRDKVEPVYRDFIELLLTVADDKTDKGQKLIKEALENFDELQLAEINNFLGCDSKQVRLESVNDVDSQDPNAVLIYSIILKNHVATIVKPPQSEELRFPGFQARLDHDSGLDIVKDISELRKDLEKNEIDAVLPRVKRIYKWVLSPVEDILQPLNEENTLVFVLDGPLRNIPMSTLKKGDNNPFLIEQHPLALTPRIQLFEPLPLPSSNDLVMLLGGLAEEKAPNLFIKKELSDIQDIYPKNELIPDGQFTYTKIHELINSKAFKAIHFKTHGVFSSDPDSTYIESDVGQIKGRDFSSLIQAGNIDDIQTIDILGLSSCQTATGDNYSVLGLTGVAVRAGARSVISSFWKADSTHNTVFMKNFYAELARGKSRAQAFRTAQLKLKDDKLEMDQWAHYVLVGNWL